MQPLSTSLRPSISRREMLNRMGAGFGSLGLAAMLAESRVAAAGTAEPSAPLAPKISHFAPRAKRVIQLFMPGGPSQVDTFDYKPEIARCNGQRPQLVDRKSLRNTKNGLMPSPFGRSDERASPFPMPRGWDATTCRRAPARASAIRSYMDLHCGSRHAND